MAGAAFCIKQMWKRQPIPSDLMVWEFPRRLFYCVGGRTAIGIQPCDPAYDGERFAQQRVGLHHLCLRARSREDVDRLAVVLREMGATIIREPEEGSWAPGYNSVLFEDPDGIRLELCYVPDAGLLARGESFDPVDYGEPQS